MRYRLIKPQWAKEVVPGPTVIEGEFDEEYVLNQNSSNFYNIYYFPNKNSKEPNGKFLSGKDVDTFNWVFADMDLKDGIYENKESFLEKVFKFPVEPTRVVDSGNGVHVYWKISNLTREDFIELQFRIINEFNTDSSVWTPLQLMRLPGTINTKKKDKMPKVNLLHNSENCYSVEDLKSKLPEMNESQQKKLLNHLNKLDGYVEMLDLDAIDTDELPECFKDLLEKDQYVRQLWNAETGKRSEADWKLAALLHSKQYHKLYEALPVLLNSKKALSKGNYRREYAFNTVDKMYKEKESFSVVPVSEMKIQTLNREKGKRLFGPAYFDATKAGWRRGEVLGMIAGSGVGKTTATLDIFYEIMKNNPENDDVFVFFSLEMQDWEIIERWKNLVGEDTQYDSRLYVVSNEDINGVERHINLQKVFWYAKGIQNTSGKEISAIALDHIGVLDTSIDVSKQPNFGIMGEDLGFGTTRKIPFEALCSKMKELAKKLNTFLIVQSQTTKGRAKDGDTELGVDAAFGTAKFEWYVDYIMTFWQPLRRVESETDLRVLAWQYGKIRSKSKEDNIRVYDKRVLSVDLSSGKLQPLTMQEMNEFQYLEKKASEIRENAEKNKGAEYSNSDGFSKLKAIINQDITKN